MEAQYRTITGKVSLVIKQRAKITDPQSSKLHSRGRSNREEGEKRMAGLRWEWIQQGSPNSADLRAAEYDGTRETLWVSWHRQHAATRSWTDEQHMVFCSLQLTASFATLSSSVFAWW